MTPETERILAEIARLRAELHEQAAPRHALKRADAALAMGVSVSKLDALVRTGKVKTAEDSHLIPMSEVRRYTAPKTKRQRRPAIGYRQRTKHADTQSDEAIADMRRRLRAKASAT